MNRRPLLSRRRAAAVLLAGACLASSAGCEQDDTVRGAGSIDVPVENLKFQPTPGKGKPKPRSSESRNL